MNDLLEGNWYHIPGYNGYVISCDGVVKSMKHFNARPEGMFIQCQYDKKGKAYYMLTALKNKREKVYVSELLKLVRNAPTLYILDENKVYMGGRNRGYMNYQKKHPEDVGTVQINVLGQPLVIPNEKKAYEPGEVKLSFSSFEQYQKKEPEPMVTFY